MVGAPPGLETDVLTPAERRRAELSAELDRLVPMIIERFQPDLLLLFGSFATGHTHEWSDIDLVVVAESTMPFSRRMGHFYRTMLPRVGLDPLFYTPDEWMDRQQRRRFVQEEIIEKGRAIYQTANCECF